MLGSVVQVHPSPPFKSATYVIRPCAGFLLEVRGECAGWVIGDGWGGWINHYPRHQQGENQDLAAHLVDALEATHSPKAYQRFRE